MLGYHLYCVPLSQLLLIADTYPTAYPYEGGTEFQFSKFTRHDQLIPLRINAEQIREPSIERLPQPCEIQSRSRDHAKP